MTEVLDAKAVVVGSPTLNNQMFPTVADILDLHEGAETPKQNRRRVRVIRMERGVGQTGKKELEAMKFDIIDPGVKIQYIPDREGLKSCYEYGKTIGQAVAEACG